MKACLEFELPQESVEFKTAANAAEVLSIVEATLHYIHRRLKHGDISEPAAVELEEVRVRLLEAVSF